MPPLIDKQLILHAGTHKTGTTAIQDSLERHQEYLAARGYSQATLHRDLRELHEAFNPKAYGKRPEEIDLDKLRGFKDSTVKKLTQGLGAMAKQRKVTVVTGVGEFVSPNEILVQQEEGSKLSAHLSSSCGRVGHR